jgi:hypothetical protein
MADRKISFKIEALGTDKLSNEIVALEKELLRLAKRRKDLQAAAKDGTISEEQLARGLANVKQETSQVSKEQAKLKKQFNDGVKAANGLNGSYDQLTAETRELKAQLRALPNAFDETNEEANKLKTQIAANTEQLKAFDKELGDNFRNVGNYADSMKEAFESTSLMSGQLQTVTNVFNVTKNVITQVNTAIDNTTNNFVNFSEATDDANKGFIKSGRGLRGMIGGLKALRVALVSTGIGAVVVALGSLFTFLTKTKKGAELLSKATAGVTAVFNVLVGRAATLGEAIVGVFENPKESLISFGELLVNNIVNRFKAIINAGGILADVMGNLFEGDFAAAKSAVGDLGQAFIQFQTGLDVEQQNAIAESFVNLGNDIVEAADKGVRLKELEINIKNLTRETQLSNAELQKQKDLLQATADDTTLSFKAREEAAEQFRVKAEELAEQQLKLARMESELADQRLKEAEENNLVTDELLDQQVEARLKVVEAENQLTLTIRDNERTRNELRQDRLERDLDILIDGFDNQKTINERIIADETKTQEERRALLEETERLGQESFDRQIGIIEEFAGQKIEADELIKESDATVLNEKIRNLELSEIIEGRLLEIIRDRKTAEQDFVDTKKDLDKELVKSAEDAAKEQEKIQKKQEQVLVDTVASVGSAFGDFLTDQDKKNRSFLKETLLLGLNALQQLANIQVAAATAQAIAQPDSVATFGATGITRAAVLGGLINAAIAAAKGAVKNAKFEQGGLIQGGVFSGPSHADGGVKFAAGGRIMEAEGGEAIINKRSTAMFKPILSAINSFGGNGKKFADGGLVPAGFNANSLISGNVNVTNDLSGVESQISAIKDAFKDIKVKNVVSDTNDAIISINNIQSEATL